MVEVVLDVAKRFLVAPNKVERNTQEQVTVPDLSPSIWNMVSTGNVGSMVVGRNTAYTFPDLPQSDEEAHESPDYQRLKDVDLVEQEEFVDSFLENPKNYERPNSPPLSEEPKEDGDTTPAS